MRRLTGLVGAVAFFMVLTAVPVGAGNATGLHWGDGTADGIQFDPGLTVVDQTVGSVWHGAVNVVDIVVDVWNDDFDTADDVLELSVATGTSTTGDLCSTDWDPNVEIASGTFIENEIHVCNDFFGVGIGWVGLSITWFIPATGEIIVAQTLLNDSFLQDSGNSTWFNDPARQLAVCQEIGHGFGVDHQNGRFKETCMNRFFGAGNPLFAVPNQHDFDQLAKIYGSGGGNGGGGPCSNPNSQAPQCQRSPQRDFGTLSRVIHVIPAPVPGS